MSDSIFSKLREEGYLLAEESSHQTVREVRAGEDEVFVLVR